MILLTEKVLHGIPIGAQNIEVLISEDKLLRERLKAPVFTGTNFNFIKSSHLVYFETNHITTIVSELKIKFVHQFLSRCWFRRQPLLVHLLYSFLNSIRLF